MKKFLFDEPDQNSSDMTVFKGWHIVFFIVILMSVAIVIANK